MQENTLATLPENLPEPVAQEVKQLAQTIDFKDPALTVSYGAKTMNSIASFADGLLQQIRAKDAGPVGEILTTLLVQVKSVNLDAFNQNKESFLSRIPLIGALFNSIERNMAQLKTVTEQLEEIAAKLDKSMVGLLTDIQILEQLFNNNKVHHQELSLYIAAGKERLEHARTVELPALQAEASKNDDSMKAQEARDFADRMDRFEKRLHDLQISRTITVQTVPQIRMIQGNDQTLAEKIQTSIMTTIPLWKNQIVLAISLYRQQKAVQLQRQVADTTNDLLRKNADMLKDASIGTAREVNRAIVDMETLREVQEKLVSTIEESLKITHEGKTRRQEAEKELDNMETNLRQRLIDLGTGKKQISGESSATKNA